jgi:anaphase-promoting complex subunit 1
MDPGGVREGNNGSFATGSSGDSGSFVSSSQSTFSRFAQSAQARQRALEPPKCLHAVYVFLRNVGKIYVEGGGDYTFHIPFLVRRAWPLRPHGVLIQRDLGINEIRETIRLGLPILPTIFSLHDPFAEPKVIGVAAKIHGAFGTNPGAPTAITPSDPVSPPVTRTPDDFPMSDGSKPTPVSAMQTEAPPLPPKRDSPPPSTQRVIWVSEDVNTSSWAEYLVVTCSLPVQTPRPPAAAATAQPSEGPQLPQPPTTNTNPKSPSRGDQPLFAHPMHLTIWRYAYIKPREVPNPVPSRHKNPQASSPSKSPGAKKVPTASVAPTPQHHDPEAARRRELQDRADRIAPSSPDVPTPPTDINFSPPLLPGDATLPITAPHQPIGAQPTLASLPGGELPPSWGHPPPTVDQGQDRQGSQDRGRRTSLSVTMDRMVLGSAAPTPGESGNGGSQKETDTSAPTFMSANHMKMQPSVWFEKIAAVPMPFRE